MSPCARWNSTPPSDHSIRCIPRCGRWSVSDVESGSSTAQRMMSGLLRQEDEPTARTEEPVRLRDPAVRVAPEARSVLGDGEVERCVGERHLLGVRLDQRELEPGLLLHPTRRLELRRRDVDADRPRTLPREPGGEVRRPAAELDHVESRDVTEHVERRPRVRRTRPSVNSSCRPTLARRHGPCTRRSSASRASRFFAT